MSCLDTIEGTTYRIYGINLASDHHFVNRLGKGRGAPDLIFNFVEEPISQADYPKIIFSSDSKMEGKQKGLIALFGGEGRLLVRFSGMMEYEITPKRITAHVFDPEYQYLAELHLLSEVLSLWLEMNGIVALHASAVTAKDHAVAFLSSKKGGKSSLAAQFVKSGHKLLTDDILPVEKRDGLFIGRPGYPQMRMWPDQAEHFLGGCQDLELIHPHASKRRIPIGADVAGSIGFGEFSSMDAPLSAIYLPERRDDIQSIQISAMPPSLALIEMIRNSFTARIAELLGWSGKRMIFLSGLAASVPMRRLAFPNGNDHLTSVRDAILADLEQLAHEGEIGINK